VPHRGETLPLASTLVQHLRTQDAKYISVGRDRAVVLRELLSLPRPRGPDPHQYAEARGATRFRGVPPDLPQQAARRWVSLLMPPRRASRPCSIDGRE
jgi:hypothetical protein